MEFYRRYVWNLLIGFTKDSEIHGHLWPLIIERKKDKMLNLLQRENTWCPPDIDENQIIKNHKEIDGQEIFVIFQIMPYIDALYVDYGKHHTDTPQTVQRFSFHDGWHWDYKTKHLFESRCLDNPNLVYSYEMLDPIFKEYSAKHPEWHLQRYYTKGLRILDHIYNCIEKNTAKEMLYKAGLDELAVNLNQMDEINLLSSKPTDLYDGLTMKVLRALNCAEGAKLINNACNREFIRELNKSFPDIFKNKLNDAQCMYIARLIHGELTVGETGRLYLARKSRLQQIWCISQYRLLIHEEVSYRKAQKIAEIDSIYKDNLDYIIADIQRFSDLQEFLLKRRKEHDYSIKHANHLRDASWQERDNGYVVRYPQTVNDFCREAIYMHNCLLSYESAIEHNETTILFMRRVDSYNTPFITIEIFDNTLMQAYHRFNEDCNEEEKNWILDYCRRHEIKTDKFKFNVEEDWLF